MKTFKVNEIVEIKNSDGSVRAKVPVELNGYIDDFTGEECFTAEELMKVDRIKARYAGIMLPSEIKALRERFHKTQEEMCDILDMGRKTWTRWETGSVVPNASMCKTLFLLRDGKIALADLCAQREKCIDWFGVNGISCRRCAGIASQFARMSKYVNRVNAKEVANVPDNIELVA